MSSNILTLASSRDNNCNGLQGFLVTNILLEDPWNTSRLDNNLLTFFVTFATLNRVVFLRALMSDRRVCYG